MSEFPKGIWLYCWQNTNKDGQNYFSSHSLAEKNNLSLCLLPPFFPPFPFASSLPPPNAPEGWSLTSLSKSPSCGESLFLRALLVSSGARSGPTWLRPPLLPIRGSRGGIWQHLSLTRVKEKTCHGDDSLDKTLLNSQFVALFFNSSLTGRRAALSSIRLYFWLLFLLDFSQAGVFFFFFCSAASGAQWLVMWSRRDKALLVRRKIHSSPRRRELQ